MKIEKQPRKIEERCCQKCNSPLRSYGICPTCRRKPLSGAELARRMTTQMILAGIMYGYDNKQEEEEAYHKIDMLVRIWKSGVIK